MGVIEALLAVVGLGFLTLLAVGAFSDRPPAPPPSEDPARPYRDGLHAAIRLQNAAQDLEHQIYAEAARHMDDPAEPARTQAPERS